MKNSSKLNFLKVFLLLIGIIFIQSCKKKADELETIAQEIPSTSVITPAFIAPTDTGFISVAPTALQLNITTGSLNGQIHTSLLNNSGIPVSSQPSFIFSSANQSVATVNNAGIVTAIAEGITTISITDGSHGIKYVTIDVKNTPTISNKPFSISFNPPFISLPKGTSKSFGYQIYTQTGQITSVGVAFHISGSGISVASSTITANQTGAYTIWATSTSTGDTLIGSLQVFVYNPSTTIGLGCNTPIDSMIWIVPESYPYFFTKQGLEAEAIRINVYKLYIYYANCGITSSKVYQTSPDKIEFSNPSVLSISSNGRIISGTPGTSQISLTYQTANWATIFNVNGFTTTVLKDITGKWEGATPFSSYEIFTINNWPSFISYHVPGSPIILDNRSGDGFYGSGHCPKICGGPYNDYLDIDVPSVFGGGSKNYYFKVGNSHCPLQANSYNVTYDNSNTLKINNNPQYSLVKNALANCGDTNSTFARWYFNGVLYEADTALIGYYPNANCPKLIMQISVQYQGWLGIQDPNITGIGTYSLFPGTNSCIGSNTACSAILNYFQGNCCNYLFTAGTMIISEYNSNYISGTFNINSSLCSVVNYTFGTCNFQDTCSSLYGNVGNITQGEFRLRRK